MDLEVAKAIGVALASGGGLAAVINHLFNRRRTKADSRSEEVRGELQIVEGAVAVVESLRTELDRMGGEIESLHHRFNKVIEENLSFRRQLQELSADNDSLRGRVEELERENESLEKQLEQMRRRCQRLEDENQKLQRGKS